DWTADFARSSELVDEAETLASATAAEALRARIVLGKGRALYRADRRWEAATAFEAAAALAERVGDAGYETLIISLVMLEAILPFLNRVEEAERISERAIALARDKGDRLHLGIALNNRLAVRIARKDVAGACKDLEAFLLIGRELGITRNEYLAEYSLGEVMYLTGDLDRAVGYTHRVIEIESRHPEIASGSGPVAVLLLARIEAHRGRVDETRRLIAEIEGSLERARGEGRTSVGFSPSDQILFEMVDLASGEATSERWERLLERSRRDSIEQQAIEVAELYGAWALRQGRTEEARRAFEEAAARASRIPNFMDARVGRWLAATGARTT